MQRKAAQASGFAYPAYAHLKVSGIVDRLGDLLAELGGDPSAARRERLRETLRSALTTAGMDRCAPGARDGASPELVTFLRNHDVDFRVRRLRFLARQLVPIAEAGGPAADATEPGREALRDMLYEAIASYSSTLQPDFYHADCRVAARGALEDPLGALDAVARVSDLRGLDDAFDARFPATVHGTRAGGTQGADARLSRLPLFRHRDAADAAGRGARRV